MMPKHHPETADCHSPPIKLLGWNDLRERGLLFSRTHVYRLIAAGKFPKPIHISSQRVAFVESEIDSWIGARIADRET
jgi:prophage regulatory protein